MKKSIFFVGLIIITFFLIGVITNSYSPKRETNAQFKLPKRDFLTEVMIENPFGENWIFRKDLPVYCNIDSPSVIAGVFQNDKHVRIAFSVPENSASTRKEAQCYLSFNPMYFFVVGTPVLIDTVTEKKRDIDYVFRNERLFFNVKTKEHVQYIEFGVASRKLKNLGDLTIEDKLKQARTIRRIRQKLDSWSPLAKGQIIAQPTLRPIVSDGGYAVNGTKKAIIWANSSKLTGKFELLDARHNVQQPDKQSVVYTGDLEEAGNRIWGGNNYVADFSDFRKEGLYFVGLKINETKEVTESYVFPIKKDMYLDLARKAAKWFYYQRCGTAVPGFHKKCHTEDAIIKLDGTKIDVTGGWHDAGDYGKWIGSGAMGVLALTEFQDKFGDELKSSSNIPELLDEAAWEARYICKTFWNKHFYPGFTPNLENVCEWLGAPQCEPPRINREADILKNGYPYYKSPGLGLIGASLARTGRQILPYDKELGRRCISIAKDVYKIESALKLKDQPGLLIEDLEFYKITKDKKYEKAARKRVETILKLQEKKKDGDLSIYERCDYELVSLYEFLKLYPEDELNTKIKDAFRQWADYVMRFANVSDFGIIGGKAEDGSLRNLYGSNSRNRYAGMNAWGLATAAFLLNDHEYLKAAEHQLQWIVGFNPADVSMMAGVGKGTGCYHTRYCFMEGCEDGIVPGGVLNGIKSGNGKIVEIGDITKNWVIAEVPVDYPIIDTYGWGWTYGYNTNEYWVPNNAGFIMGAIQVEKALRSLK